MTIEEFLKLSPENNKSSWRGLQVRQSLPWCRKRGTKTVEFLRVGTGPLVAELHRRGRWWRWAVYCDGWSEPRAKGRSEDQAEARLAALLAIWQEHVAADERLRSRTTK